MAVTLPSSSQERIAKAYKTEQQSTGQLKAERNKREADIGKYESAARKKGFWEWVPYSDMIYTTPLQKELKETGKEIRKGISNIVDLQYQVEADQQRLIATVIEESKDPQITQLRTKSEDLAGLVQALRPVLDAVEQYKGSRNYAARNILATGINYSLRNGAGVDKGVNNYSMRNGAGVDTRVNNALMAATAAAAVGHAATARSAGENALIAAEAYNTLAKKVDAKLVLKNPGSIRDIASEMTAMYGVLNQELQATNSRLLARAEEIGASLAK